MAIKLDRIDRKILNLLQEDCTISVSDISAKVALSSTPCWRRIQRMEKEGIISKRVALLNPKKINADVTAFVAVKTNEHNNQWLAEFKKIINVPGSIIEIGVNYGQGLLTFANLLETFCCSDRTRIAIGFEAGNGYKKFSSYDKKMKAFAEKNNNDYSPSQKFLEELIEIKTADNLLKGAALNSVQIGESLIKKKKVSTNE